jgi:acyl-CoA synthetase (NDP forming)/GNAT superfamily N-acetyltransferase
MSKATGEVYALLADGTTVEIRPAGPGDFDAVKAMHEAMSPDNTYLRFFNLSRLAAETEAQRICRDPGPGNVTLLALAGGELVGVGSYAPLGGNPGRAEVAFAVADHMHHRGIATLLLEHLVSLARSQGITAFTAETLTENTAMLNVFADAGLPVDRHYADGVFEMTFPLPDTGTGTALDGYLSAVAEREGNAEAASLRHVLAPESVVVVGAGRRRRTVGRTIVDNIRGGGFAGRIYTVNPRARQIGGERCLPSVRDLPEPVDLAVIAVPAAAVLDVAEQCGQRGVHSIVVVTSGLDTAARADLLAVCRRHGMRLVGPGCFGVAVPGIGLDATFAASDPKPGSIGLVSQSGGLGFAMVDQLSRLGLGISSFVSVGDKLDVSSNDMLMWWEHDGVTKLAVLYIESFGNPRKFARTARRISGTMPVLTVLADQDALLPREALFEQAGVITTRDFGELIEATALLATQPVPAGRTVAIVSNVGSAGVLAAGTCASRGLTVHRPRGLTRRRLRALVPGHGVVTGPVDTTAAISGEGFRRCLELTAADEEVHALIALVMPTGATGDLVKAIRDADVDIPLAAVVLNETESVRLLPRAKGRSRVPAYGYPEAAVAALARAAGYGAWRAEPRGQVPEFPDIKGADARALVREFLGQALADGWLPPGSAAELLRCYGITLAHDENAAAGTDVTIRVTADRTFGPLVEFGLAGPATEVLADRSARLTPLTDTDADKLIRSIRSLPLLLGSGGRPATDLEALRNLLLRVSRLADDLPEVAELDLSPVIAGPGGTAVVSARIKLLPHEPHDPFLRKLR